MIYKQPIVLDTSHYNKGIDWSKCADLVAAVYCKATEGYYTLDDEFPSTWRQLLELKKPRAPYHFYRETWFGFPRDPIKQAQVFFDYVNVNGGLIPGDKIVLDAEDPAGMTIQKVLACGREMRRLFNQWPVLYSGYYKLKEMKGYDKLTQADIDDLHQMGVIIACYPDEPDKYQTLPSQYVPDPVFFGPVVGWQYAGDVENHGVPGIPGSLDFNLFDEKFLAEWQQAYAPVEPPEPPAPSEPPVPPAPEEGAAYIRDFEYNGAQCHVISAPLADYEIVMDAGMKFETTDRWLVRNRCNFAINGLTGWYQDQAKRRPVTVLDGVAYYHGKGSGKFGITQTLYIDDANHFSLDRPKSIWNAYGFPNLLIKDGQVQPIRKSTDDIRARTALGVNKDQTRLYLFVCDGGDYWVRQGLNFQDVADVMLSLGCDLAVMSDGGGSTTMVKADFLGQPWVIGKPSGEEDVVVAGQIYHMRPVAVHFGLKRKA